LPGGVPVVDTGSVVPRDPLDGAGSTLARSRHTRDGDAAAGPDAPWRLLAAPRWQLATKRTFDIVASVIALVLLAPLLAATAIAIVATSRGGALFRQVRVGRDGRPFTMLKFRTMHAGADALMPVIESANELDGPIFKIRRDPRVTRLGRTIRRYSVDELPQLVNVIRGDMSLVGPRPLVAEEYRRLDERWRARLLAAPGLTGAWQAGGRCDVALERWMELDLGYIRRWSLGLDLRILARTVPAVLLARGSY
jgi:lipopolysaccharide/colanic/teichoic acid biosynthesis glycosyltransferase